MESGNQLRFLSDNRANMAEIAIVEVDESEERSDLGDSPLDRLA